MTTSPQMLPPSSPAIAVRPASMPSKLAALASDIKIHHSIFALPFALLATFLAGRGEPMRVFIGQIGLIVLCMVTARTVAMTANRLLDAEIDARNPRTARRAIPGGVLSRRFVAASLLICVAAFIASSALFWVFRRNPWPVLLSVPVLAYVSAYPLLKHFTRLCHYYLGAALGLAPVCAWVAITGHIAWPPILMFAAVTSWTAGFDIIYACQDYDFDVSCGLFSLPSKLGIAKALWVSRLTHVFSAAMLIAIGLSAHPPLGILYFLGVGIAIVLLIVEHSLVKPTDLSKLTLAFFTVNGIISLLVGTLGILDVLRH